ncbi:MAG: FmdB family transcriptional regulator [Actinomycetota bacterium]|nr:FmdB family transcriptional regulator [Actinomycetota bacterium]
MPTYEYACKECGKHLEVVQSFDEPSLTTCPACQGRLRKVFGSIGISFKGSGFYKTDSRGGSSPRSSGEAAGQSSANGDGAGASPSKTEGVPAQSGEVTSSKGGTGSAEQPAKKQAADPAPAKSTPAKAS